MDEYFKNIFKIKSMSSVISNANIVDFKNRKTNVGVDTSIFNSYEIICDTIIANRIYAPSDGMALNGVIGINTESTAATETTTIAGTPLTAPPFTQSVYIGGNDGTTWGGNTGNKNVYIANSSGTNAVTVGNSAGTGSIALQSPITYRINTLTVTTTTILSAADSGKIIFLSRANGTIITLPIASAGLNFTFIVKTPLSSGSYVIQGATPADLFYGGVVAIGVAGPTAQTQSPNGTTQYKMTLVFNDSGGQVGTEVKMVSSGANVWVVGGTTASATANGTFFTA